MQTVEQWLHANGQHIGRLYRGDMRFLLDAPCNEAFNRDAPRPFYVVAMRKTQAPLNYKLGHVHVHGFERWKLDNIRTVSVPVWLVIAEALTGELLAFKVSGEEPDDTFAANGMVYFRKSRFTKLADLAGKEQQLGFGF